MTAKLNIHIDRGGMPRSGILNKKFDLLLDDRVIGALGWGEKRSFTIPAGDHKLQLNYRHYNVYYKLDIHAKEGGTVDIDSVMNPKKGGFKLFNRSDGTTSEDRYGTGSSQTPGELLKSQTIAREELVVGACASAGILLFIVLNILTGGKIPGGFLGGIIGGGLGILVGIGINSLRRKGKSRS